MNLTRVAAQPLLVSLHRNVCYDAGLELQQQALQALRQSPAAPARLLLVEHTPVVTLGRSGDGTCLKASPEALAREGIDVRATRRGGDVTYHGPGQWTLYPILRLAALGKDLHKYLRMLEEVALVFLARHGVEGRRIQGWTGVWISGSPPRKIAAIGVSVSHWISSHGMAVNIAPDLSAFHRFMVPCGIPADEGGVTSLAACTGRVCDMQAEGEALIEAFGEVFPYVVTRA